MIKSLVASLLRRSPLMRFGALVAIFAAFVSIAIVASVLATRRPTLEAVIPSIASSGEVIVITGKHFGQEPEDGWIEIAGNRLSGNSYISWNDSTVMVVLPETAEDGLLFVCKGSRRSNPLIFANRKNIPVAAKPATDQGIPEIASFDADKAEIGKRLVIRGKNFGIARNDSTVLFSWLTDGKVPLSAADRIKGSTVACLEQNFDYEFWSDQEIRVRVPDGATSGPVFVRTARGVSNDKPIEILSAAGAKTYTSGRTFVVSGQIDITNVHASDGGMIFLRYPLPITSPSQRDVEVTASEPPPYLANWRGGILHQLDGLKTGRTEKVNHTFVLTTHGISTKVNPAQVKPHSDQASPLFLLYTQSDPLVPSDTPDVRIKAADIVGKERNPWKAARFIYDWLTETFRYDDSGKQDRTVIEALNAQSGSAYDMAILFCAMARSSGIPAVPLAGIVVDANRESRVHWWAEFYVESVGWIPVDPALAIGKPIALKADGARDWYFGNLDPYHISFSRGWTDQKPMTPKGKIVVRPRSWAFQPIWEESAGNIKGYASYWGDPRVTGVY